MGDFAVNFPSSAHNLRMSRAATNSCSFSITGKSEYALDTG